MAGGMCTREECTILVVFGFLLVVLAAYLGPFRKVVLRRGVGHLAVQSDDFFT